MKKHLLIALLAPLGLWTASANAILLDDFELVLEKLSSGESQTITHDLTPEIPTAYEAYWGLLTLFFVDDSWDDSYEYAEIELSGDVYSEEIDSPEFEFINLALSALVNLNADGLLDVTVTSTYGDFYWVKSYLLVKAHPKRVPEPATLALLGAGLIGVGLIRRRSKDAA